MGTNTRSMIRCILPYNSEFVHNGLRQKLCDIAGGWTEYTGRGGWHNGHDTEIENNVIYEVSFPPSENIKRALIAAFIEAGAAQGEQETYIEYHTIAFEAYHAKTG